LSDVLQLDTLSEGMKKAAAQSWRAAPLVNGEARMHDPQPVRSPADNGQVVGEVAWSTADDIEAALASASAAAGRWDATPGRERAACLRRYADLLEQHTATLVAICAREAGKHIPDGIAEVREAVDFCRYYAVQIEDEFDQPTVLPGPTGERN